VSLHNQVRDETNTKYTVSSIQKLLVSIAKNVYPLLGGVPIDLQFF